MSIEELFENKPYKIFFPISVLLFATAVSVWPLYFLGYFKSYPLVFHSHLMFYGGFYSFILAFLMTVFPRITHSRVTRYWEIGFALVLLFFQVIVSGNVDISVAVFALQVLFLCIFHFSCHFLEFLFFLE